MTAEVVHKPIFSGSARDAAEFVSTARNTERYSEGFFEMVPSNITVTVFYTGIIKDEE